MRYLSIIIAALMAIEFSYAENNTMCVFGDSYVSNHHCPVDETWHAQVAKMLELKYVDCGINGNCVAFDRVEEGYGKAMINRVDDLPDSADIIILIAGHNDAGMIANNDSCSITQFTESLDRLLKMLKEKYPMSTIGYVTPWHVERSYFPEIISEIKSVCADNSIPVLDSATSGIEVNNPEFRAKYFQGINDTAHLNKDGHNLLVEWGKKFVITCVRHKQSRDRLNAVH